MPLLGTKGAASAQAFGMFSTTGIGGPYWIGVLVGSSSEEGYGIAVDNSGNVYLVNQFTGSGVGIEFSIVKYNSSGTIQWQRQLGGASNDYGYGIAVDSSSNVYVIGYSVYSGINEFQLAKYNSSGTIQWQRRLGSATGGHIGQGIAVDSSSNVYVIGYGYATGLNEFQLAKYNSSGTIQWQRRLGGAGNDYGYGIGVDGSGNVYISGNLSTSKWGVAKYNTSGTIQWQRSLAGTGITTSAGAAADSSGNVYVVGRDNDSGTYEIQLAKYNTSGTIQWQRRLGSSGFEEGYGVAVDSQGNVYVNGYSNSTGTYVYQLAKYNTSGTIQWQRRLGRTGSSCVGYAVATDSGGSIYVNGSINTSGVSDILFGKFPGNGSLTGTYTVGSYTSVTYAASSLTDSSTSLTDAASSLTDSSTSLTDAASTLTSATSSLTSSVTQI